MKIVIAILLVIIGFQQYMLIRKDTPVEPIAPVITKTQVVEILVNRYFIEAHNISIWEIIDAVSKSNITVSAGVMNTPEGDISIRTVGEVTRVEELGNIIIRQDEFGANTKIRDVATIGMKNIDIYNNNERAREITVKVNERAAAQYGLTVADIGIYLRAGIDGINASKIFVAGIETDVIVRFSDNTMSSVNHLKMLKIPNKDGALVPFSSVARVSEQHEPAPQLEKNHRLNTKTFMQLQ